MKYLRTACLLLVLSCAMGALGQSPAPAAKQATPAPQGQPQQPAPTMASVVDREISSYEKLLVDVAEIMPEDKYNFTPDSLGIKGSSYAGVRTFAQLLTHTAAANFRFWSSLSGDPLPDNLKSAGTNGPEELKTKAQIVQFVKDSFAVGHRAAKSLTTENALEPVQFRNNTAPRMFLATFAVIHDADEYGQMVEYLRMNGITPPASAGR
jgi:hypothetical protein